MSEAPWEKPLGTQGREGRVVEGKGAGRDKESGMSRFHGLI